MLYISSEKLLQVLNHTEVINALREIFVSDFEMPFRHHHFYKTGEGIENTLILMPSWNKQYMGIKQVVVAPGNPQKGLPSIQALYTLINALTGVPLAIMDAAYLTSVRTACTSALAANYLAVKGAETLLVVGTGKVAFQLVQAHTKVRQYKRIFIWGRNTDKATAMSAQLAALGYKTDIVANLEDAVKQADVISCATMAETPLIKGEWLRPGQHLDLVGAYKPNMRESDDEAVLRSQLFVDSRKGALHEAGELAIPLSNGLIQETSIQADIKELCGGSHKGRATDNDITLFKSMGLAVEDLAAALLAYKTIAGETAAKNEMLS